MSMTALPLPPPLSPPLPRRGNGGRFLKKSSRQRQLLEKIIAPAVAFFFEDIEKLHESGRISVFTNETP
jgi:hypothetical protein